MVWDDMAADKVKPTIAEMATSAVSFLQAKAGPEGFFIMIEVEEECTYDMVRIMLYPREEELTLHITMAMLFVHSARPLLLTKQLR